jgi:hypothetical protein
MAEKFSSRRERSGQAHLFPRMPRTRRGLGERGHLLHVVALLVLAGGILTARAIAQNGAFSLSGSVVNSVTGEPISRALVQMGAGGGATLTDSDGHFEFEGLTATQAVITARKPGFFNEQEIAQGQGAFAPTRVTVGPDAPSPVLRLVPEGVISGHITVDGEPIENIPVKLVHFRIVEGRRRWEMTGNATTDSDGEFRIADLVPGMYYAAFGPHWTSNKQTASPKNRQRGYPEVFFPGANDLGSAAAIELNPGQNYEADISLRSEPLYNVSGVVSGYNGPQGVNLSFINSAGDILPFPVQFNRQGSEFYAQVTSGSYTLHAEAFSENASLQANLPITVSSDLADVHVVVEPDISIPINVRTESTGNQAGKGPNGIPVTIELSSSVPSLAGADYFSSPDNLGNISTLAIRDVAPGRYYAQVNANGPFYVQSAQCGGVDLLRDDLNIVAGARVPPIEVILRDDGGSVTGSVNADKQSSGTVYLIPDRNPRLTRVAREQGQFSFNNVAPGDYSVLALDGSANIEYTNPEVLAPYMGKAVRLTLSPNGTASAPPIDLVHAGK